MNTRSSTAFVCAAVLALAAGHAAAQNSADPVLQGPKVKDNGVPGERGSFSKAGKAGKGARAEAPLPPRMFLSALKVLRGDDADAAVRLTQEQDAKIRGIQRDFGDKVEAYMEEHGAEVRELIPQLPPEARREAERRMRAAFQGADRAGKRPKDRPEPGEMGDMMDSSASGERQAAAKARLKELLDGAPDPKESQGRVWMVLSEPQRALVEKELKRMREETAKGPKPLAKPLNQAEGGKEAPQPNVDKLPANLRKRLEGMSPEEREEAIRRLQERRRSGKGGQDKPAPDMEDVKVPAPTGDPK